MIEDKTPITIEVSGRSRSKFGFEGMPMNVTSRNELHLHRLADV